MLEDRTATDRDANLTLALFILALTFNAILAFVNENVTRLSDQNAIFAEIFIISAALIVLNRQIKLGRGNTYFVYVFFAMFFTSFLVFAYNQNINVKSIRDFLIILVFWKIGISIKRSTYFSIMRYSSIIVLLFSILEIFAQNIYTAILNPWSYYYYTRGVTGDSASVLEETGLYKSTDGYLGRFSINFLSDHRLASVFLEPVSFGKFVVIALIFCIAYWSEISRKERFLYIALFAIGTIGSDSRTATFISIIILLYLPVSKWIKASVTLYYIPLVYVFSCALSLIIGIKYFADTLEGRLSWAGNLLLNANITDLIFGNLNLSGMNIPDAGYFYVITTHTIFGLIILMIISSIYPKDTSPKDRVLVHGLVLFFAIKLLISSSIFSIKISPFLWVGIGFVVGGGLKKFADQTSMSSRVIQNPLPAIWSPR